MKNNKKATVKVEVVTPTMAKNLLKYNTKNRHMNKRKLQKLIRDFKNGDGVLTSDAVGIDVNNVLTNGGHRLTAIVKSGVSVPLLLVKNLPPKARDMVDTGTPRNFKHSLEMNDLCCKRGEDGKVLKQGNFAQIIASASSYIILHQTNNFKFISSIGEILSNSEIVDFVKANEEELMDSAKFVHEQTKGAKYILKNHLLFVYQMHKLFDVERANYFVKVVSGNAISSNPLNCPAHILKNKLIEDKAKKRNRFTTKEIIGLYVDASNKFMKNLEVKGLRSKATKNEPNNIKPVGELSNNSIKFFNSINFSLHKSSNSDLEESLK